MNKIYNINKWAVIITLLLFLTFWGGIMAEMVLGIIQIAISFYIMMHFSNISKKNQTLFIAYSSLTIGLIVIFKIGFNKDKHELQLMFVWIFVSMFLALFHLYLTYKIKNDERSNF